MSRESLAVTGSTGQVGSEVVRCRPDAIQLTARLDEDWTQLLKQLDSASPRRIINCAAYTQVDQAESEPQRATLINAQAPERMARWCLENSAHLVHFSTDYVFDGTQQKPYQEHDQTCPSNRYGESKLVGEIAIQQAGAASVIFRTSWVIGKHGHNFIKTILRLGCERNHLRVVADQWGRPTSADLLAEAALAVQIDPDGPPQLMHLTDSGEPTTWFELACYTLNRAHDYGYPGIDASAVGAIPTSAYPTAARRPLNSLLDCSRFDQVVGLNRLPWQHTLDGVIAHYAQNW